jgi:hypothetical protein
MGRLAARRRAGKAMLGGMKKPYSPVKSRPSKGTTRRHALDKAMLGGSVGKTSVKSRPSKATTRRRSLDKAMLGGIKKPTRSAGSRTAKKQNYTQPVTDHVYGQPLPPPARRKPSDSGLPNTPLTRRNARLTRRSQRVYARSRDARESGNTKKADRLSRRSARIKARRQPYTGVRKLATTQ